MRDFLVIGGGIAGLSAAARLSDLGAVTLLEAEEALATQTSARSAAIYEAGYGATGFAELIAGSRDWLEARDLLSPRGLLIVGTPDTALAFEADVAAFGLTQITREEARGMWPVLGPAVDRIAVNPDTFDLDTHRMIEIFRRQATANRAEVHTRAPVTAIARTDAGWQVTAGDSTFEARMLINAAGAWADRVAQLAGITPLGITPHRRSMARLPTTLDVTRWPMVMGAGESWYCKPDAGALLVSPAEEDPMEPHDAWADDMVLAEGLARFEDHAVFELRKPLATWAGLRSFAPDRQPVLGPSHEDPSFIWCAGQGGSGFQSTPAASALLADLVAGRSPALPPEIVARVSAARFAG